ncbi:MAG: tRNA lysidine(34) synthetase TilS, partial [Clostridia bacterium]|nr:tRNA lysidine(34) synthetase TilS [Clostridia bacterium]
MCNAGDRVLVALSGGADSVALLHALLSLREELKLTEIAAAHLHHGLRGEEADRDLTFVQSLCQEWQVPLVYTCEDVAFFAAAHHLGVEEAGRQVRYAFLQEKANGALIATAHTATDNVETILLHLTRGCGLQGLTGIAPCRDGIIRPLIDCSREEVEAYCRSHALSFVTDSTNADVRYARNRIRHEVLPALHALNPSLEAATKRLVSLCAQDNAYLNTLAEQVFTSLKTDKYGRYALSDMRAVPPALRGRVWQMMLTETALSYDDVARLEQALGACGSVCLQ